MKLYNTKTRQLEEFKSITPEVVKMYSCGPTVYDSIHVGNLRAFTFADILKRTLILNGYKVVHVMNITDFGHLVGDGDDGEDKMSVGLKREGLERSIAGMKSLADKYSQVFLEDTRKLNLLPADVYPRAIEHIDEYIQIIKKLDAKGFIYTTTDGVYFDTSKDMGYGKMALLDRATDTESRIETNTEKKNNRDFALWKFADEEGAKNGIGFNSPWGFGFPGWHIECSGMAWKYLGEHFDIHTGGVDHIAVHHTNEIAQSENAHGTTYANYFCHNEFLNMANEKMSKSKGNVYTLRDIEAHNITPLAFRYFLLQSHYSQHANFTWEALEASQSALGKLYKTTLSLKEKSVETSPITNSYTGKFDAAVSDNLNTAAGLALLWEMLKDNSLSESEKYQTLLHMDTVLGLKLAEVEPEVKIFTKEVQEKIDQLIAERNAHRENKNWTESDRIRDELLALGYTVADK
jgi:cysteinyl-tRNA synthetase